MPDDKRAIEPIDADFEEVAASMVGKRIAKPPKGNNLPAKQAEYSGTLAIGGLELSCFVTKDGERFISGRSMTSAIGMKGRGQGMARISGSSTLKPFMNNDLIVAIEQPALIVGKTPKPVHGYRAEILADLCDALLEARQAGALKTEQEERYGQFAEVLVRAFARVGIAALVDEATGYQYDRKHDALRILLSKYIEEGLRKWIHTFLDTFFEQLDRLYGNPKTSSRNRPQYYGGFINKYIYNPIENGYVKARLNEPNITDEGKRRARFHQWLTDEGRTILLRQIGRVEGVMEMCDDIEHFKRVAARQKTITVAPYLFDEMNRIID